MITGESVVRRAIKGKHPNFVVNQLVRQVSTLLNEGQPESVLIQALEVWESRDDVNPTALPYLVSDVVRRNLAIDRQKRQREASIKKWEDELQRELKYPARGKS